TRGRRWISPAPRPAARTVAARLSGLIHEAARLRQDGRLLHLERALAFAAGGHTAGEEMLIQRLVEVPDRELAAALGRMMPQAEWDSIEVRLTGLILFSPQG
ncbi:MAG TPA: hypothetical protein VFY42_09300, partial [Gemmatimonadales bacterium]|nr:hypothetical protein [Gemmatimonadales bacterium]